VILLIQVRFVETFEAWLRRMTGNMIIEFSTYGGSEAFMQAAINNEIPFLRGAHVQHIGIVRVQWFGQNLFKIVAGWQRPFL